MGERSGVVDEHADACVLAQPPLDALEIPLVSQVGLQQVDRNTPSVINSRFYRWYGWDGAHDSLWAQSVRPLLDPREMTSLFPTMLAHVDTILPSPFTPERIAELKGEEDE